MILRSSISWNNHLSKWFIPIEKKPKTPEGLELAIDCRLQFALEVTIQLLLKDVLKLVAGFPQDAFQFPLAHLKMYSTQ